jgi:type I restriction enzyme, S subunit
MSIKTKQLKSQKIPKLRFPDFSNEWKEKRLGEVSNITMGQSPDSRFYNKTKEGEILIQGNADIINRKVVPRIWTTQATQKSKVNDLIMTVRAPVGYIAKSNFNSCIGRGVCSIKNNKKSNNEFLYQFLLKFEKRWIKYEQGSTFKAVNSKDIKKLKTNLPQKAEQQKIASFLGLVDKWIENLRTQKENLGDYKKGMMQKIFSQKIRFKNKDGKNFGNWEEKKLGEVFEIIPTKLYQIKNTEILKDGKYKVVDQGKNKIAGYSNNADKLFKNDEVIVFGDHTTVLKYIDFDFIVGADGTKILKNKEGNLKYLYYNLDFNNIKAEGYKRHFNILKNIYLQISSLSEQQKIAKFLTSIDNLINSKQQQITQAEKWKRGVMQELFV